MNANTGEVDLDKSIIFMRKNFYFGNLPASPITEVSLGKFSAGACLTDEAKKLLADSRYADDFGAFLKVDRMEKIGF